jgi:anti-sigma-K factor RskA
MKHEEYKEMIPAHALSALDPTDDRMLADHLVECSECRHEFDEWQTTTAALALSSNALEPSPQLREQILLQVRTEKKIKPSASNVIPFAPAQKNVWSSFGSLGAIAAIFAFAVLAIYAFVLWRENRSFRSEVAALKTEIQTSQLELDRKTKLLEMVAKPGMHFAELKGMPMAPTATAKMMYDTSGHAMIMTRGLPAAPADKEYQLWFIVPGKKPMPGKTFTTDNRGQGMMEDQVPAEAMNSAVFAITLERKGGVSSPEGSMYLSSGS